MRILFLTHHRRFKTFARSTPMARELARTGHDVALVCISAKNRLRFHTYSEDGVRYVETPDLLPGRLRSGWDPISVIRRCSFLRRGSWDLIHAFESRPATIHPALRLARKHRLPLVMDWNDWWGRGGLITTQRPGWYQRLFGGVETYYEEHFRCRANATTVISRDLARRAADLGVDPAGIFWIPGGADTAVFVPRDKRELRSQYEIPPGALVLGFSALDVTSDADIVLKALAHVTRARPDVLLIMAGNRPAHFDDRIASFGVRGHVRHLGPLPLAPLAQALSVADILLLPLRDTIANRGRWPNKICDYMSLGRPTIAQPVGDIARLFSEYDIGLLATDDPENFAARIIELANDPARMERLGRQARRVAVECFAWPVLVRRLEACYAHALKSPAGAHL